MTTFNECDCKPFYNNVKEAIPPNAPKPQGKPVDMSLFVDADHAHAGGDHITCKSRTRFFIFMNNAPIVWCSKWQITVES
jgi:hypothetical protein